MAVVIASDIGKDIAGDPLMRGVSFKLERRDRMTLSGRNGAGKTTLLRDARGRGVGRRRRAGVREGRQGRAARPAAAARTRRHAARLRALRRGRSSSPSRPSWRGSSRRWPDGAHDEPTLNAYARAQAALDAHGGYRWRDRAQAVLHGLGFGDEQTRPRAVDLLRRRADARLARARAGRRARPAAARRADEPPRHRLARVAREAARSSWTRRSSWSRTTAGSWRRVGTAVLEIEAGRSRFFAGPWHTWRQEQAARELALGRAIDKQRAEIARLERFVERFRAKATKARQAQSRVKRLERIERIERDPRDGATLAFSFKAPERAGRVIFELRGRARRGARPHAARARRGCGSSAASTSRSSGRTAPARRR